MIHSSAIIHHNVRLGKNVSIGAFCIIGETDEDIISIGDNTRIGHHSYIFGEVKIGRECEFDAFTRIGDYAEIGDKTRLLYGARVHCNVVIGNSCIIAGNCPDQTIFGDHVIHLGKISHSFYHPFANWDAPEEPGPTIASKVVIGTDANLIGPVNIGENVFIFPREIVRHNIPPNSIFMKGKVKYMPNWSDYLRSLGRSEWKNKT